MEFDYRTLELLRDCTSLDPISYFKVLDKRKDAKDYQIIMNRLENCHLGVDYTKANKLEAQIRFNIWASSIIEDWQKNGGRQTLEEYAFSKLQEQNPKKRLCLLRR